MNLSDLRKFGLLAAVRRELRPYAAELRRLYFNKVWGMDIAPQCAISFSAKLDKTYPRGIHIGQGTAVNFDPRHPAQAPFAYLDRQRMQYRRAQHHHARDQDWRQLRGRGGERRDEGRAAE